MDVTVIGAGVGGLCAAIELAHAGHRVRVLEQADVPGGKCMRVEHSGYAWDAGPSLLTLPHVFASLFAATGAPLEEELELLRVEPVTRYEFADGSRLELSADLPRALDALEHFSAGAAADWARFLGTCAAMWSVSESYLAGAPPWPPRRPAPGERPPDPRDALRVKPWWTLRQLARAHTRDPRLRMVIERFATYAGADPRRAPAALAVAGYVEHAFGAWHPRGGVYELVRALARRLELLGGELRTGCRASRLLVREGRVRAVETDAGAVSTDAVLADVDEAVVRQDLLGMPRVVGERSLSGLALLLGVRGKRHDRAHHVIRFPSDYDAEFDDLFLHRCPVRDPTLYLCSPGVTDPTVDPPDGEALFVLANAPAIGGDAPWELEAARLIDRLGLADDVAVRVVRDPGTLARETGALDGAIYGGALHGRLATLRRPGRRVPGIGGLWVIGGTVHPGGGLPIVALGARAAARELGPP